MSSLDELEKDELLDPEPELDSPLPDELPDPLELEPELLLSSNDEDDELELSIFLLLTGDLDFCNYSNFFSGD